MTIALTITERAYTLAALRSARNDAAHRQRTNVTDSWQYRNATRDLASADATLAKFDAELDSAAASLIGRECSFSFEPYHSGKAVVHSLERRNSPHVEDDTYWTIVLKVSSGKTSSRLMGATSVTDIHYENMDCPVSPHNILEWAQNEDEMLVRHVYPCG